MLQTCCKKAVQEAWARPARSLSRLRARPACALFLSWDHAKQLYQQSARYSQKDNTPLRKRLKDETKARKIAGVTQGRGSDAFKDEARAREWELTVGIEIHAQLNAARKLFSGKHTWSVPKAPTDET